MARFLIAPTAVPGHVLPLLAVSQHLVSRGHEVVVYTGSLFRERAEATGARFVAFRPETDIDYRHLEDASPEAPGRAREPRSRLVERGHRILRNSASAGADAGGPRTQSCDEQPFATSDLRLRAAILQRHPREARLAPSAGISFRHHDHTA